LSQFKKYHPSGNLKFNYLSIFQSLKLLILMEKNILISLRPNFSLGCYGLKYVKSTFEKKTVLDGIPQSCLAILETCLAVVCAV